MDLAPLRVAVGDAAEALPGDLVEAVLALVRPAVELAVVEPDDIDDDGEPDESDESDDEESDDEPDEPDDDEDDDGLLVGDYGGLPAGVDWPVFEGEPLILVARLRCDVLAELLAEAW